jgi:DNA-binding transcriptional LysR family regulator
MEVCRRISGDRRLKIVPAPVHLGTFPVHMAWHVRYRQDQAHQWLRERIVQVFKTVRDESEAGAGAELAPVLLRS